MYSAYYSLADHQQQMQSYIFDIVRASLCTMTLDDAFKAKEEISSAVKVHLAEVMNLYGKDIGYIILYTLVSKQFLVIYMFVMLGYAILSVLITDLDPDERVRNGSNIFLSLYITPFSLIPSLTPSLCLIIHITYTPAMNEINAAKRLKESAYNRAEGEKIIKVKRAEAEAESMYLSGVGVSKQRHAIMNGLK